MNGRSPTIRRRSQQNGQTSLLPVMSEPVPRKRRIKRVRKSRGKIPIFFVTSLMLLSFAVFHLLFAKRKAVVDVTKMPKLKQYLSRGAKVANGQYAAFVTKSNGLEPSQTRMARSPKSVLDAIQKAQGLFPKSSDSLVKIDIVTKVVNMTEDWNNYEGLSNAPDWWFGLALNWETGWVFTPDEVHSQTLVDQGDRIRFDRLGQYALKRGLLLEEWPVAPSMMDDSVSYEGVEIVVTTSLFCDFSKEKPTLVPLIHGHQMFPNITADLLMERAKMAGTYLAQSIREDGSMLYLYQPRSGTSDYQDNILRQSSSLHAMALLYMEWKDAQLLLAMQRGLKYVLSHVKPCALPNDPSTKAKCVEEKEDDDTKNARVSSLGTNVHTLLALVQYMDATGDDDTYLETALELAKYIVGSQKQDGSFVHRVELEPKWKVDNETFANAFQGEATFCLSKLYRVLTKLGLHTDKEWIHVASRSANYMIAKYGSKTKDEEDSTEDEEEEEEEDVFKYDSRLIQGISELHFFEKNATRSEFALRFAREAQRLQIPAKNSQGVDQLGCFDTESLSVTSCATYVGAVCAMHDLAIDIGKHKEAAELRDVLVLAERGLLQAQYGLENAMHMKAPNRIIGAFRESIARSDTRNYYTQHNLSSMLCVARLLREHGSKKK